MFVGREIELALLKETILFDNKATLIYGKRRVGKTSLIKKAVSECGCRVIYYECTRTTLRENVRLFDKILIAQGLPRLLLLLKPSRMSLIICQHCRSIWSL